MSSFLQYIGITTVALVVIYLLVKKCLKRQTKKRPTKSDMVVLHQFAQVNGSPPCLKLETFLRMANIPYENDYGMKFSKKGKKPWIEFNGQEIADSNFCIQFLKREFKVDIDSHLSDSEKAIAHSVLTMLEENTYWALVYYRWCSDYAPIFREKLFSHLVAPVKCLVFYMLQRKIRKNLWAHGIGRHTEQELFSIAERDLLAASDILGQKKFLFGEKPCLADAALFAFVAASAWESPKSPFGVLTKSKAKNLAKHAQRMKEQYYPEWDEIVSKKRKSE